MSPTVSTWNDVWERSAKTPYWWRVTTQIWVGLLIGWGKNFKSSSFLRRHLPGKPLVESRNVCFLRLMENWSTHIYTRFQINFNIFCNLHIICNSHKSVSSFCEENNFKPCLTKQLLNVFKLWCEWGISLTNKASSDWYSDEYPREYVWIRGLQQNNSFIN